MNNFSCPRTCPRVGKHFCQFNPILSLLGSYKVHSHTVTVQVEYKDPRALERAVLALGGIWYGQGTYSLGDTTQVGHGFRLPMARGYHTVDGKNYWYHPLVLRNDGQLAYDAFGGSWGDLSQLPRLKDEYAYAVCEQAAIDQGWQCERTDAGLTIYHPAGGVMTVSKNGEIDAAGFVGHGCHDAILSLGLPILNAQIKPEYGQVAAEVRVG